ncbi:MAG: helix-turn-helix domain-containing protein [Actinomycetales bacterium]|nr:helix-turn-helix domain-containing protein [Actinomycetales bacterium]
MESGPTGFGALQGEALLTPGEVAALFRVDPKTVTRWAISGKLPSVKTPGGHRRYRQTDVTALLTAHGFDPSTATFQRPGPAPGG